MDFEIVTNELKETLALINDHDFNQIPLGGGWTIAQTLDHIQKANIAMLQLIVGKGTPTDRDPAAKIVRYVEVFNTPQKTATFLEPSQSIYDRQTLSDNGAQINDWIRLALATMNLKEVCDDFEYPELGAVTKLELSYFIMIHTRRHMMQIQETMQALNAAKN